MSASHQCWTPHGNEKALNRENRHPVIQSYMIGWKIGELVSLQGRKSRICRELLVRDRFTSCTFPISFDWVLTCLLTSVLLSNKSTLAGSGHLSLKTRIHRDDIWKKLRCEKILRRTDGLHAGERAAAREPSEIRAATAERESQSIDGPQDV